MEGPIGDVAILWGSDPATESGIWPHVEDGEKEEAG